MIGKAAGGLGKGMGAMGRPSNDDDSDEGGYGNQLIDDDDEDDGPTMIDTTRNMNQPRRKGRR